MTERDYKKEYRDYHSKPENMADRVKRNLWNRRLKDKVPPGKEIDHKNALASGGSNDKSNIRFRSISSNRADKTMVKASAYGATLGALAADEGVENKIKGATAGTIAGWAATPPSLLLAASILKNSDGKIDHKKIKDMTTSEFAKNLVTKPKEAIKAIGKKKFFLATVGTPYALGGIASLAAGKYFGRTKPKGETEMQKIAVGGMIGGIMGADEGVENKLKGAAAGLVSAYPAKPAVLGSLGYILKNTPSQELFDVVENGKTVQKTIKQMTTPQLMKMFMFKPEDGGRAIKAIGWKRYLAGVGISTGLETGAGYAAGKYFGRDKITTPDIIKRYATKEHVPGFLHGMVGLKKGDVEKKASIEYRGQTFEGYNKPKQAPAGDDHKMVVLAKKGDEVKLVRFGKRGYEHNYSSDAKQNYLNRSAGIRDKNGNLTKDNKLSANYWARKTLWPKNQEADGKSTISEKKAEFTDYDVINKYRSQKMSEVENINILLGLL